MSKNHPHDNIYNILSKLKSLEPTPADVVKERAQQIRESVESQGSILKGLREVSDVEQRLTRQFAESNFSKLSGKIQKSGKSKASADAITASIGRKKLGQAEMTRRSVAGKKHAHEGVAEGSEHNVGGISHSIIKHPGGKHQVVVKHGDKVAHTSLHNSEEDAKKSLASQVAHSKKMLKVDEHFVVVYGGAVSQAQSEIQWLKNKIETLKPLLAKKPSVARQIKDLERQIRERELIIGYQKEGVAENAKPDYIDLDKDGNKKESMKKASADKKKKESTNESLAECAMCEAGTCTEHGVAEDTVHKGTYGTSYDPSDEEKKTKTKHVPKAGQKGRPKQDKPTKASMPADPFGRTTGEVPKGKQGTKIKGKGNVDWDHDVIGEKSKKESRINESVNFQALAKKHGMGMDECMKTLNDHYKKYQMTGECSDLLNGAMQMHRHHMEEGGPVPYEVPAVQRKAAGAAPLTPQAVQQQDAERSMHPPKLDAPKPAVYDELDELAKLAGITDEGNAYGLATQQTPPGEEIMIHGEPTGEIKHEDAMQDQAGVNEANAPVVEPDEEPINNAHKGKYQSMKASTMGPGEGDAGEKTMHPDRPTFKNGDNPLATPARNESTIKLEARLAREYESIKKKA